MEPNKPQPRENKEAWINERWNGVRQTKTNSIGSNNAGFNDPVTNKTAKGILNYKTIEL